jgi:hypothetical protein
LFVGPSGSTNIYDAPVTLSKFAVMFRGAIGKGIKPRVIIATSK